ncbi:MAG: alpha-E domain-containing protein [Limisphaerales bacterium]
MLSRVAHSLYWMARYIERAENIARLVDVNLQLLLDLREMDEKKLTAYWLPIVQAAGDEEAFFKLHPRATGHAVTEFLVFQAENPNSIVQSVCAARENARMVRDQITQELWEELNRLYLFVRSPRARQIWHNSPTEFFQEIKSGSLHLIGLASATLLHDEGWWFVQTGQFIERGDKTTRILDVRYETVPERGIPKGVSQTEAIEWAAVLRSCSAWDAYKSFYGAEVHPRLVAEFLLLNDSFPRSLRFCVSELNRAIRRISGVSEGSFSNNAEKLTGRLLAELQFSSIDEIFDHGLHKYLDEAQLKLNNIGEALFLTYIFQPFQNPDTEHMVQQEEQQQQQTVAATPSSPFSDDLWRKPLVFRATRASQPHFPAA